MYRMPRESVVASGRYVLDARTCTVFSLDRSRSWQLPLEMCEGLPQKELPAAKLALREDSAVKECYVLARKRWPVRGVLTARFELLGEVPTEICEADEELMARRGQSVVYDVEADEEVPAREFVERMRERGGAVWFLSGPV